MSEDVTLDEFVHPKGKKSEETEQPELIQGVAWSTIKSVPDEWTVNNVESDIDILSGNNFSSEYFVEDGGIPLIRIRDLAEDETTVNFEGEYDSRYTINQQDLLVGMDGEFEPHLWAGPQALLNQRVCKIEPKSRYNKIFFRYAIEKPLFYIQKSIAGTTVKHLSQSNIKDLNLPTPPLPEQRKIATVLYTVDRAIEKTEEIINQGSRLRQATEQDLFREGYFEHDQIEEQRLVEFPDDWNFEQLSEHTIESAFGPRYDSEKYDENGAIATLRTTDLDRRGNITPETMPRADLDIEEFEKHLLKKGDLIVSRSGAYSGITTTWEGHEIPTIPGAYMIRFRLENTLNPKFLRYYFNSNVGRSRINRRKKGSGQQNIAGSDLLNMRVPIPSKEEQEKIVSVIDSIESNILSNKDYRERLKRLKRGLMQDLLSGTVRTTDTNIEVPEEIAQYG